MVVEAVVDSKARVWEWSSSPSLRGATHKRGDEEEGVGVARGGNGEGDEDEGDVDCKKVVGPSDCP